MNVEKMISIGSYATTLEAELARDYLATEGIDSYLDGANTAAIWQLSGRMGTEVQLLVAEQDEEKALAALEARPDESISEEEFDQIAEESGGVVQAEPAGQRPLKGRADSTTTPGVPFFVGVCFLVSPIILGLAIKLSGGSLIISIAVAAIVYVLLFAYYKYNQAMEEPTEEEPLDRSEPDASDFTDDND